jgi:hypothetical protein
VHSVTAQKQKHFHGSGVPSWHGALVEIKGYNLSEG